MTSGSFKYAIKRNGKNYGISNIEQLKDMANCKKIQPQDYIYCYGTEKWVRAGQISALSIIFAFFSEGNNINRQPPKDALSAPELSASQVKREISPRTPDEQILEPIIKPTRRSPLPKRRTHLDLNKLFEEFDHGTTSQTKPKPRRPSKEIPATASDDVLISLSNKFPARSTYFSKKFALKKPQKQDFGARFITLLALLIIVMVGAATFLAGSWLEKESNKVTITKLLIVNKEESLPIKNMSP